jgi:MFS family permease
MDKGFNSAWLIVAAGLAAILSSLLSVYLGRLPRSWRRRWDYMPVSYVITREHYPICFWLAVAGQLLIGAVLLYYGIKALLNWPRRPDYLHLVPKLRDPVPNDSRHRKLAEVKATIDVDHVAGAEGKRIG